MVDSDRAAEVLAFLDALNDKTIKLVDPSDLHLGDEVAPDPKPQDWLGRIVMSAVYLFTGTAPALRGRFGNGSKE